MEHHLIVKHGAKRLWPLLGPFLCDRGVLKEMHGPMYSGEGVTWFFALDGDTVVGFCSLRETKDALWFDYAYVVPDRRGKGVYARLAAAREAHLAGLETTLPIKVAVPRSRWKHYRARGWKVASERGSWVYGVRS